jgi:hypothetical protein
MNVTLLILHGVFAFLLLGAITHQAVTSVWPRKPADQGFIAVYRGVHGHSYTNAVIVLYLITFVLGGYIYIFYRIEVRPPLEALLDLVPIGVFEIKEHFLAIALGMLPAYWYYWKKKPENKGGRVGTTLVLAFATWVGFIGGHFVNNVRGLL